MLPPCQENCWRTRQTSDLEEAKLLLAEGRYGEAESRLRSVVAADPANSMAHAMLGDVLGEFGTIRRSSCHAAQGDGPGSGSGRRLAQSGDAYEDFARRSINGRATRGYVARARPAANSTALMVHFAFGKAYNDLGEYARAIDHFDEGNRMEHKRHRSIVTFWLPPRIGRLIDDVPPRGSPRATCARQASCRDGPRDASVRHHLIEQIVSAHPQAGAGGELTILERAAAQRDCGNAPAMATDYLTLLRRIAPDAARVTDKKPFNFLRCGLIHLAFPAHGSSTAGAIRSIPACRSISPTFAAPHGRLPTTAAIWCSIIASTNG